jgi:hypothetical protein
MHRHRAGVFEGDLRAKGEKNSSEFSDGKVDSFISNDSKILT